MKLFTCGELKQLTFSSYDDNCVMGKKGVEDKPGSLLPVVDEKIGYDLYKNTKKIRKEKDGEKRAVITRISSSARILKLETAKDFKRAGMYYDREDGQIKFSPNAKKLLGADKIDGIYITEKLAEKLKPYGYEHGEQLKIINPEHVSSGNSPHKSGQRSLVLTREIRKVTDDINRNYKDYARQRERSVDIVNSYNFQIGSDGRVYSQKGDFNQAVQGIEKMVMDIYSAETKPGGILYGKHIPRPVFDRKYNNCSAEHYSKEVEIGSVYLLKRFIGIKLNTEISEDIRKNLTIENLVKSIYYHELGHLLNNPRRELGEHSAELRKTKAENKPVSLELHKASRNGRMYRERAATDFALNKLKKEGISNKEYKSVMYAMGTALHSYDSQYKEEINKKSGQQTHIGGHWRILK